MDKSPQREGMSYLESLPRRVVTLYLPRTRVTELIEFGVGEPFDAGKGKPMKEWVGLLGDEATCRQLVAEALSFVRR